MLRDFTASAFQNLPRRAPTNFSLEGGISKDGLLGNHEMCDFSISYLYDKSVKLGTH